MENYPQEDLLNDEEVHVKYGAFWPRFWAILLDWLVLSILTPLTIYNKNEWKSLLVFIVILIIQIAYKPLFEYVYGATPGKMALKLKVVNYEFRKASLQEILLRNIFHFAGGAVNLGIGLYTFAQPAYLQTSTLQQYEILGDGRLLILITWGSMLLIYITDLIVMLSSPQNRSLHDRIGKTFVIRT